MARNLPGNPRTGIQTAGGDPVIVSGASGFIGRRLAVQARARFPDSELHCYAGPDRFEFEVSGKAVLSRNKIGFVEADFVTGAGLVTLKTPPRIVFYLAANSATWKRDHRCNDVGTQKFIQSLKELGRGSHVLFASSIAVMDTRADYEKPVSEHTPTLGLPLTPYGASKLRVENWLREEARRRGFSLSILRLVTVYGGGARPNTVLNVLNAHVHRQTLLSRLNWPGLTGLVHVDDAVNALLALAQRPPPPGTSELFLVQAEARSLAEISGVLHRHHRLPYRPITLSKSFWTAFFQGCRRGLGLGALLPCKFHGSLWRLRLLAGNVFWCDTQKLRCVLPDWRPALLEERIGEAFNDEEVEWHSKGIENSPLNVCGQSIERLLR